MVEKVFSVSIGIYYSVTVTFEHKDFTVNNLIYLHTFKLHKCNVVLHLHSHGYATGKINMAFVFNVSVGIDRFECIHFLPTFNEAHESTRTFCVSLL